MAWWVNQTPATGDAAVYGFVDMLLHPTGAAPWTVPTSGDASVYAQSGNVIASAASLVPGAWLVLRSPAYYVSPSSTTPRYLEYALQRGSAANLWRIKRSVRAGFTGGSPGPERTPSATDEVVLLGGGTDASPTYAALLPTDATYRLQACGLESAIGFYLLCYPIGGGQPTAIWWLDPIVNPPVDAGELSFDPDPWVSYLATTSACRAVSLGGEAAGPKAWLKYGAVDAAWVTTPAMLGAVYDASDVLRVAMPAGLPTNPWTGDYEDAQLRYVRRAALGGTCGDKRLGSLARWCGTSLTTGTILSGRDASGVVTDAQWIVAGDVLLPWDGITPTAVQ